MTGHVLREEDALFLAEEFVTHIAEALEWVQQVSRRPRPRLPDGVKLNQVNRLARRLRDANLEHELPLDARLQLAQLLEESVEQERKYRNVQASLRAYIRLTKAVDEVYDHEERVLGGAMTQLVKEAARGAGDADAVREVNQARRKAGRSRRK